MKENSIRQINKQIDRGDIRNSVEAHVGIKKEKIFTLDFVRILLAVFVFLFHSNIHLGCTYKYLTPFISQGAIFMSAFFILSGFSLYYNYYDKELLKLNDLKSFYFRRLVSIYPLYFGIYIIYLLVFNTLTIKQNLIIAPIELLLLQSFIDGSFNILHNGGTWFVSCILFCYLLFPFLKNILVQIKFHRKKLLILVYFICSIAPIIIITFKLTNIYSNPFFRLLEFLIGMMVATLYLNSKEIDNKHIIIVIILEEILLVVGITLLQIMNIGNYTLYGFFAIPMFSLIIYHLAKFKSKYVIRLFSHPITQYISKISYAFFLAQFFTWSATEFLQSRFSWFETNTNMKLIFVSLSICLLIAILLHEIIEKPAKKIYLKGLCKC